MVGNYRAERAAPGGWRRATGSAVSEGEDQAQCGVDGSELVEAQEPDPFSEPARVDCARLLDEDAGREACDLDTRAEGRRSRRGRRGRDQPGRQLIELVGLHDDGFPKKPRLDICQVPPGLDDGRDPKKAQAQEECCCFFVAMSRAEDHLRLYQPRPMYMYTCRRRLSALKG